MLDFKLQGEKQDKPTPNKLEKYALIHFYYAHMQIVVALIVVNFFSFSVITRPHELGFGPSLDSTQVSASRSFLYSSGT